MTTIPIPGTHTTGSGGSANSQTFTIPDTETPPSSMPCGTPESPFTAVLFRLSDIRGLTQHLTGRLKTLIDGAIGDPTQRKALKQLIHEMTWMEHYTPISAWAKMAVERKEAGTIYMTCPPFASNSDIPPEDRAL